MKAGIYVTPNGNLIYVAKDRTIKATSLSPSSWSGTKVSHRSKDDTVLIEGTDYRCERLSDVPNGCTDPEAAIKIAGNVLAEKRRHEKARRIAEGCGEGAKSFIERVTGIGTQEKCADDADFSLPCPFNYRAEGYRRCHKQSARKHRKRGDHVIRDGEGGYMWRPRA